jgi:hypothetical protein
MNAKKPTATAKTNKPVLDAVPNPGLPSKSPVSHHAFSVSQSQGKSEFEKRMSEAAWFKEPSTGAEPAIPMMGVLIKESRNFGGKAAKDMPAVLLKGGVLLRAPDGSFRAVQPDYFRSRFIRCFSDGTEICRLSESKMEQAMALSKSNTQLRKRIQELASVGIWKAMVKFLSISRNSKKMKDWSSEIQAHVFDLTLRHKTGLS